MLVSQIQIKRERSKLHIITRNLDAPEPLGQNFTYIRREVHLPCHRGHCSLHSGNLFCRGWVKYDKYIPGSGAVSLDLSQRRHEEPRRHSEETVINLRILSWPNRVHWGWLAWHRVSLHSSRRTAFTINENMICRFWWLCCPVKRVESMRSDSAVKSVQLDVWN